MNKPKQWKRCELMPIKNRPGNISIDPKPQESAAKRDRLQGKPLFHGRRGK